ncbi:MAG: hypothetical protein U9R44_03105 [Candidatus Omnitrophota bacterium]|nr:hypothetical protein [Candidatus Omnitrophota bacterium]
MVWLEFLICSALMIFCAYHLCKEGVLISRRTRLEEGLIGMFFLALATSFPEMTTGSTAVFFLGKIGLGYGDIVGSIIVNLMILLFLDYYQGRGRILLRVSRINRLTGIFALLLISVVLVFAVLRASGVFVPGLKGLGVESVLIAVMYLGCLEVVRRTNTKEDDGTSETKGSLLKIWAKFIVLLVIVMLLGMWLAKSGEKIANTTGLSQTFIGTLFLGLSTSFPEMIVSFTALRAGSVNMAVGNILGSNLFDVFIIPFLDGLCGAPILGILTSGQMIATVVAVLISLIAVIGLFVKRDTSRRINWDTGLIFTVGLAGFVLLYFIR